MTETPTKHDDANELVEITGGIQSCYPQLYKFLLRRVDNRATAQDLAQEAYLRLLRIEKKHLIRQPAAYLFRIAANLVYEFQLKERRSWHVTSLDRLKEMNIEPRASDNFSRRNDNPEYAVEQREALKRIQEALTSMPPLYASVLVLCKRDGLSHQEIAEKLEISIHTVRKYLTRAVVACRALDIDLT